MRRNTILTVTFDRVASGSLKHGMNADKVEDEADQLQAEKHLPTGHKYRPYLVKSDLPLIGRSGRSAMEK